MYPSSSSTISLRQKDDTTHERVRKLVQSAFIDCCIDRHRSHSLCGKIKWPLIRVSTRPGKLIVIILSSERLKASRGLVSILKHISRSPSDLSMLLAAPPLEPELEKEFLEVMDIVQKKKKIPKEIKTSLLDLLTWAVTAGKKARDQE